MPPRCPVCLECRSEPAFAKEGFDHYDCRPCGALFLSPLPSREELDRYYVARADETCSSQCWAREEADYRHYEPIWAAALQWIERCAGRGPLLDVGCGGGQFLAFARSRGWAELEGIELSPPAAARARERAAARIHERDFLASDLARGRYAGVTMWNVIEHAPSPRDFLAEAAALLRPGAVWVADCPNRRGLTLRILGPRAYVVMPPEHLTYFSRRAMQVLVESAGLRVRALGSNTIYINDWVRALSGPMDEATARASHLSWYGRATGSKLGLGAIAVFNRLLDASGLGDQLFVAAQKRCDRR